MLALVSNGALIRAWNSSTQTPTTNCPKICGFPEISPVTGFIVTAGDPPMGCVAEKGGEIDFPKVTVGGTHTALMAASLASGETVIENAAREPEVVDVAECLIKMGAKITGHGTSRIVMDKGGNRGSFRADKLHR